MPTDYSKWTLVQIKKFIDVLMEVTVCNDVQELKDHIILESVWKEVEKKLNEDQESLKNLWYNYLHLQLFCIEPIYMNEITIKLIECIHAEDVSTLADINWKKVGICFDGISVIFLRKTFYKLLKLIKRRTKIEDLKELVDYLYDEYIPIIMSSESDQILPRLKYDEERLSYIDRNFEIKDEPMDEHE